MLANWDANQLGAVLRATTQVVLNEMLPINTGGLRFSRPRATYPRPVAQRQDSPGGRRPLLSRAVELGVVLLDANVAPGQSPLAIRSTPGVNHG
jgi:hypothetical protein